MYSEDDLIPISALQHLSFCERQWGLIHLEQVWTENQFTAEGRSLHEKTHDAGVENRPGVRIVRGLRLQSLRLGLVGQADVVEFVSAEAGVPLEGLDGLWRPFPVEYKRGKAKSDNCDRVQLCAQAMCLEEMLATKIECGALFYGRPRRREQVTFNPALRAETEALAKRLHDLFEARRTPRAKYGPKCRSCSLLNVCMPKVTGINKDIAHYLAKALEE
jgi:CRISPR-associated exonuclease Cas4